LTLQEKILLIDQYIKKEPDTTIKDYSEAVKEIEFIERSKEWRAKNGIAARLSSANNFYRILK